MNSSAGARTQQVALSLVFAVLDVPRAVQAPRLCLPVGDGAAPGTKSKP